jgi:hypothetical protein
LYNENAVVNERMKSTKIKESKLYGLNMMGISLCTWSLWGWFFSQHLGLFLEQLGQHLRLLLEQLGQQHLGCFIRTAVSI